MGKKMFAVTAKSDPRKRKRNQRGNAGFVENGTVSQVWKQITVMKG